MNCTPTILALTPTLGRRVTLHSTINSVSRLASCALVDHFLVGPTDTLSLFTSLYPKIKLFATPGVGGIFPDLSLAYQALGSSYDFFFYINDDDYILPEFSKLIAALVSNSRAPFSYGKTLAKKHDSLYPMSSFPVSSAFPHLLSCGIPYINQQAVLFRTSSLPLSFPLFNSSFTLVSDSLLIASLIRTLSPPAFVNQYVAVYSFHQNQLTSNSDLMLEESSRLSAMLPNSSLRFLLVILFRLYNLSLYIGRNLAACRSR
jgi:hypothetical protein